MKRKLHVLSLIDELYYVGGGENRLLSFARTFNRSRFDHTVATLRGQKADQDPGFAALLREAGIVVRNLGFERDTTAKKHSSAFRFALSLWRKIRRVSHLIRELDIDVVDAHLDPAILIGVLSGFVTRARTVITVYEARPFPFSRWTSALRWLSLRLADVIITDSQSRRADIQQFVRRRDLKIKVIPNGIPPPLPMRSRDEMRQALAMPDSPATRVVGQISRLVSFKGQSLLLKAARTVLDEYPNAFFLVIGYAPDPSYQKRLVKQAADLGISDRVRITGYVGPIGDVWQMIDLQAHASLLDSLPNAIIEGMSLGKTAVVTPVGGIPEAVEHGKTGLVVPPGDPKALSAALLRLLREPDTAEGMGKAAYKRYEERYRPEIMSTAIEECFQEVVR